MAQGQTMEKDNKDLRKFVADLTNRIQELEVRIGKIEESNNKAATTKFSLN